MKFKKNNNIPYVDASVLGLYQEGGEMMQGEPAPMAETDPLEQILMAAQQAVETNDGQMALQVCQALVAMATQGQQQPPMEEPPMEEPPM